MRARLLLLGLLAAPGCQSEIAGTPASLVAAGAVAGSYVVLQRNPIDAVYSLVTGQDCSTLHIERRGEYCRTRAVEAPPPFCTRSLAGVDCWTEVQPYGPQRPVADTPERPEVEAAPWPPL